MMRTLASALTALSLTACVSSLSQSGTRKINEEQLLTQETPLSSHKSIQLSGAMIARVIIDPMQPERLVLKAEQSKALEQIQTDLKGEYLSLSYKQPWGGKEICVVEIYSKGFSRLKLSGAADCEVRGLWSSRDIEIESSGASDLDIMQELHAERLELDFSGSSDLKAHQAIKVNELDIELSGASDIRLKGEATRAKFDVSGASTLLAQELKTEQAKLDLSGASDASIRANHSARISASGASDVKLYGRPSELKQSLRGASTLQHRN